MYAFNLFMIRFLVSFGFEVPSVLVMLLFISMCAKGLSQMALKFSFEWTPW